MKFILRNTGNKEWSIYTENDVFMHTLPIAENADIALDNASAWISSWSGATIRIEDEQSK